MKIIKPTKGVSQKLVVKGLYENYFFIMGGAIGGGVVLLLILYDYFPLSTLLVFLVLIVVVILGMYIFFLNETKKGQTKQYPKGDVRITNKDF